MANYLRVSMRETVKALYANGWSERRVAKELGINRRTVARYIRLDDPKRAISTAGLDLDNEGVLESKRAISTTGFGREGRKSHCAEHHDYIEARLKQGFSAQRIYQDLRLERDFKGSYESVKRYARQLSEVSELPFRRIEVAPGKEVQIDYGTGAWVIDAQGRRRKTHLFRATLSYSRKGYSEVSYTQDAESFVRSTENAFRHFGGVTEIMVIDNLKAGVIKPCVYDPELNPKLRDFAEHYGTCVLPTKIATPRHKGKVESAVKYVQNNALKGRSFNSVEEQNVFLLKWEESVADTRIHGTTKRQVSEMFKEERPFLRPLPPTLFPVFTEVPRKVHRDGHIEVAKAFYSVPPEYVRREVWARYDHRIVSVFNHRMQKIAIHPRKEPGHFSTMRYHTPIEKISNPERGNLYLINQADLIGLKTGIWARQMLKNRGIPGTRVLNGLLQLASKYTAVSIDNACGKALEVNVFNLRELKEIIAGAYQDEKELLIFIDNHPLIREMSEYENMTHTKEAFICEIN